MNRNREQINNKQGTISKDEFRNPILNDHAEIINSLASFMDIPERKHLECILLESENRFKSIFDTASDAIFILDWENDRIIDANPKAIELLGYTSEEIKRITISKIHPKEMEKMEEIWSNVNKFGVARSEDLTCTTKNNKVIPADISFSQITLAGNKYLIAFIRDITERKQAEEELKEANITLKTNIDQMPIAYITLRTNFEIHNWNPAAEKIFGFSRKEAIGRDIFDLIVPKDIKDIVRDAVRPLLDGEAGSYSESDNNIRKDGKTISCLWYNTPIKDSTGKVTTLQCMAMDITRRKRAEGKLEKALAEVERLKNRLQAENIYLREEIKFEHNFEDIISNSEAFGQVLRKVKQVSPTDTTVLILGETGTGKELIARAVHNNSVRQDRTLVKVNCAALPENLIESELFGHERGAFTGAFKQKIGRFELADGGTIFLDEIGELPTELQAKLLRVLQEGEFERLGSSNTRKVDVRVIAATSRNLEKAMADGDFLESLYYRLNVFPIKVPPLRERKEDIPLLAKHFMRKYSSKMGKRIEKIPERLMETLQIYNWPGNVRELENMIERLTVISEGNLLDIGEWPLENMASSNKAGVPTLRELEIEHITKTLELTGWRVRGSSGAAKILGIKPSTLEARMKKLDILRKR